MDAINENAGEPPPIRAREPLRILLLEDNPDDAEFIERSLQRAHVAFTARRVESREEFVQALGEFSPDLILADHNLPAFDSHSALRIAKECAPNTPVIVVTGVLGDELAVELLKDGASDYILKDRLSRLAPAVRRALDEARAKAEELNAKAALHESEERFRLAMKGANDGLWDWDLRTDAAYYSPRWKSMLGYGEDELDAHLHTWKRLTHPDDVATTLARVQDLVAGRTDKFEAEFRMRHRDGRFRTILSRGFLLRDAAGRAIRLIGTHVDVTEREHAHERIMTLSRLYATLSASNSAMVRSSSRRELCEHICRIAAEKGGWAAAWIGFLDEATKRIVPEAWSNTMGPVIDRLVVSVDPAFPEGRGPSSISARTGVPYFCNDVFADASIAPWYDFLDRFGVKSMAAVPLRRENRFVGVMNLYSDRRDFYTAEVQALLVELSDDISFALDSFVREERRKAAETALAESEAKYRGLVEQHITGIYIIQDGAFVYVNPRFAEIFGYRLPELAGMKVALLVAEKDRDLVMENIRKRFSGEVTSIDYEFTGRRKDGSSVEIGVHGTRAAYGGKPAIIGVLQDITDRKTAQARAQQYLMQLEKSMFGTIDAVSKMVEMRDPYTAGHEQRVSDLAAAIGREMRLPDERIKGLRVIGLVHDIGKISCPAEILSKPGALTSVELLMVQAHSQLGYDILKGIDFPWPVAEAVLQHHERLDGSGYPLHLKGDAICLEARVIAVADVVEAMATHRPYRAAVGLDIALQEIERGAGTQYDAQAVGACLRLFRELNYNLPD